MLVHCERGQRRSPTIVLAWMLTQQGYTIKKAIDTYANQSTYDANYKWSKSYKEDRPLWIEMLTKWGTEWKNRQIAWIKDNESLVRHWKSFWTPKSSNSTPSGKRKLESQDLPKDVIPSLSTRKKSKQL